GEGPAPAPARSRGRPLSARVHVDRDRCCGHGRCYSAYPDLFRPNEMGEGVPVADVVDAGRRADLMAAVEGCPEEAISVVLDRTPSPEQAVGA
ncbi:MAG: ferredoxin, partial [Candidatus Dormibacteria bacterium]